MNHNDWISLVVGGIVVVAVVSLVAFVMIREWLTDRYITRFVSTTAADRELASQQWETRRMHAHSERIPELPDREPRMVINLDALEAR